MEPLAGDGQAWAFRMVGEFIYRFAQVERAIDDGMAKVLGLEGDVAEIVASSIPLAKKVEVLFSAETVVAARPSAEREKDLDRARSSLFGMNQKRNVVAHSPFEAVAGPAVSFRRTVTSKGLRVSEEVWDDAAFGRTFLSLSEIEATVRRLVDEMKPYEPSLDFSDGRNSWLIPVIL